MKLFVDENIPKVTVEALVDLGHDVRDIRGTVDQGMADDRLWAMVQGEQRLLVTTDKGFTAAERIGLCADGPASDERVTPHSLSRRTVKPGAI